MEKLMVIKKSKKYSHIVGKEFEEKYRLGAYTERIVTDMINEILNEYVVENEVDFDGYEDLGNLKSGTYHIDLSDFIYTIEIIPSKLIKKIDEYNEFYDFQLQSFDAVYNFFSDETMIGIDETSTYKINNAQTITDYVVTNQKENIVGFLQIVKGKDFYSYEIN